MTGADLAPGSSDWRQVPATGGATVVRIAVDKDPRDPNFGKPHSERIGNCAELAAQYQAVNGGILVHGSIFREGVSEQRIGHAWVWTEDGGTFEPTLGLWFPHAGLYAEWAQTMVDITYDREEACINMLVSGNYGIWHDDPSGVWGE